MFTIIIATTIHDINSIITYVSIKKDKPLHSISVIVFLIVLSLLFAVAMLICGRIFAPNSENSAKNLTYGCVMTISKSDKLSVNPRYFILALLFLLYDAEILLLFPFALAFNVLKLYVFLQAFIFISIMILSIFYAIQKNIVRFR